MNLVEIKQDIDRLIRKPATVSVLDGGSGFLLGGESQDILGGARSMDEQMMALPELEFVLDANTDGTVTAVFKPSLTEFLKLLGDGKTSAIISRLRQSMKNLGMIETTPPLVFKKDPTESIRGGISGLFDIISKNIKPTQLSIYRKYFLDGITRENGEITGFNLYVPQGRTLFVAKIGSHYHGITKIWIQRKNNGFELKYMAQGYSYYQDMRMENFQEGWISELREALNTLFQ